MYVVVYASCVMYLYVCMYVYTYVCVCDKNQCECRVCIVVVRVMHVLLAHEKNMPMLMKAKLMAAIPRPSVPSKR